LVGYRALSKGKWEGLFLREVHQQKWEVLAKTRGRSRPGEQVIIGNELRLVLESKGELGSWIVRPVLDGNDTETTFALLQRYGQTPIPPYIRQGRACPSDQHNYQTVYARRPGSVAAPTAGLHFTEELINRLAASDIICVDLLLHVGLGTFRLLEVERLEDHIIHAEWAELSPDAVSTIQTRRAAGGRIVAVGTTSARVLETASGSGTMRPFSGETNLFIQPGHRFHGLDGLITNFHLPKSTLLVLVSAFAGFELTRAAYAEAVRSNYRFFSYGDAMLIL
jgi:S-adenosylmethionine:tRNA ribosyltransferase-isomerase